ncbi:hypothetical protein Tco_1157397 [Tanacetum coccineum]
MRHSMRMLVKDTRSQDGIDDKDNDKGSKSRSQSMKEQAYNKEQRERPRPHELNDKSNLIDLMKEYSYCLPRESIRIKRSGQAVVGGKIFWVIYMPEEMLVGQCLPSYYISQLGDCIIISGSFKFVDFSIIYAWELQVDDDKVSWYRKLFTLRYPIKHDLKLIGFTKDKQPIVEASFVKQLH